MVDAQRTGPLAGLLVADFSRILAGPYATMLLADLGAEVVKVEAPSGDDTRTWVPPVRDGRATYYLGSNRGKRSIALDLRDDDDRALAHALADRADVLVENLRHGHMARFGLGPAQVAARNPGVVYASITGFGTGAGAELPGYDLLVQGLSGLMHLTGEPDGPAQRAGVAVFDVIAGLHALAGILAALRHRERTGQGQHVEVDLLSSALSGLVNQASAVVAGGAAPRRMGNAHPSLCPYEPIATSDGAVIVIAANDDQFRRLCELLGLDDLADDVRFRRNEDRTANRDELLPRLRARFATATTDTWTERLTAAGLPAGPVNDVAAGVALADELGLAPVVAVGEPGAVVPTIRNPIGLSATPASYHRGPPDLDEHRDELVAWLRDGAAGPPP